VPTLSDDRRWYWNGQVWMPVPSARDDYLWFTSAPDWLVAVVLMSLVFLIPFAGQMAMLGWVLEAKDNIRLGHNLIPPAGFSYMGRGVRPYLASVIMIVAWLALAVAGLALVLLLSGGWGGFRTPLLWLLLVAWILMALMGLALILFLWGPALVLADEKGLSSALNPFTLLAAAADSTWGAWRVFGAIAGGNLVGVIAGLIPFAGIFVNGMMFAAVAPGLARCRVPAAPPSRLD
jgi:hypothetical protein